MKTSPNPQKRFDAASAQRVLLLGIAALTTGLTGYGLTQRGSTQTAQAQPAQTQTAPAPEQETYASAPAADDSQRGLDYSFGDDEEGYSAQQTPQYQTPQYQAPQYDANAYDNSGVQMVPQTQRPSMGRTRGS